MIINFFDEAKSYTALLLQQFSNLQLKTSDTTTYNIPILFATPDRLHAKLGNTNSVKYRKPIMSLMLLSDEIDLSRSTNRLLKRKKISSGPSTFSVTYNDQPVNLNFELWIKADTLTSLTNIISAISTSFYNKVLYLDYKSPLGETISTPIILDTIEYLIDNNEEDVVMDRTIDAKLNFIVQGVKHSQIQSIQGFIKEIDLYLDVYKNEVEHTLEHYLIK